MPSDLSTELRIKPSLFWLKHSLTDKLPCVNLGTCASLLWLFSTCIFVLYCAFMHIQKPVCIFYKKCSCVRRCQHCAAAPHVSLIGHVHTVRIRNCEARTARASSWVESGTAGSTADQMDMKRGLCHSLQISKTERFCSLPPRNDESQGGVSRRGTYNALFGCSVQ